MKGESEFGGIWGPELKVRRESLSGWTLNGVKSQGKVRKILYKTKVTEISLFI